MDRHGELSGEIPKRILVIWESGMADLHNARAESWACKRRAWRRAVRHWELNEHMVDRIWDLWRRYDLRTDVIVLTRPQGFASEAKEYLELHDVPVRHVVALDLDALQRRLVRMPDVHAVLHRSEDLLFAFSSKGRLVQYGEPLNL